jgi:putative sterol carrier protein
MSMSPTATDHHQTSCDALERTTPLLVEAIRRAPADVQPTGMRWTNAEIAAHLYASVLESHQLARGVPSLYDGSGPTAELDEKMVATVEERDMAVLAGLVGQATTQFLGDLRALSGQDPVAVPRATVSTLVGLLAADHHLHGGQLTQSAGTRWTGQVADLHAPLSVIVPYAFDPEAARGFIGSYTLRLKGVAPVRYAVVDGDLDSETADRTDCTITADPQTFLRMGIGVVSQRRAVLTGRLRAGGRRPWLATAVTRLFPPIPHGGVVPRASRGV